MPRFPHARPPSVAQVAANTDLVPKQSLILLAAAYTTTEAATEPMAPRK
jgi:hypothetical protein